MLGVAFTIGVLLALTGGTDARRCVAPEALVSRMLGQLEGSVSVTEPPNPSVLLAMNLAGGRDSDANKLLLRQIEEEAVKKAQGKMTSGQVALYVLALLSSCQKPQQVQALGQSIDLVRVLQQKTDEEVASLETDGVPITSLFSVSLDALALCLVQAGGYESAAVALARQVLKPGNQISVDTRAMVVQALVCTYGHVDLQSVRDLLWKAVSTVTNDFLNEQERRKGQIGNIYSMGVALQALETSSKFYAPREWDCAQAFNVVYNHDYHLPMAIAQVLPALVDKPYLQAASLDCTAHTRTSPDQDFSLSPSLETSQDHKGTAAPTLTATIEVHYSIINKLQGAHFNHSIQVEVPAGSTLLRVLKVAEEKEPDTFSFKTEQSSWGPMVVSIHGLAANPRDRTFWEFLSGKDALEEGVGTYKPHDMEHITANFTKGIW
ncbi:cobalamin binding intrinsic factor-like [Indicator indicator]|uniref:cobalamin binding intrinsic factor-like n=1 Tax=Indicator indicator TaxID=1002788 RepID=UPI0023DF9E66|nr:cobalamin binding intrinsic factor-like [Indicator indicator]